MQLIPFWQCPDNQKSHDSGRMPSTSCERTGETSGFGDYSSGESSGESSEKKYPGALGGSGGDGRKPFLSWPGNQVFFQLYLNNELDLLLEYLKLLVAAGVPLNLIRDNYGCNLLHLASCDGHQSLVWFLVSHIPINEPDNQGWTPLHYSSHGNHFAIANTLLFSGADVNAHPAGTTETPANCARTQEMLDFIRSIGGEGPNHLGDNWHPGPQW